MTASEIPPTRSQKKNQAPGTSGAQSATSAASGSSTASPLADPALSIPGFRLSPSVSNLLAAFADKEAVSAAALVRSLLDTHPGYAKDLGTRPEVPEVDPSPIKPARDWLIEVGKLYDPHKVTELHGRLVILGLARLDTRLGAELDKDGLLRAIQGELAEPFESLLAPANASSEGEHVRLHWDDVTAEDQLGREPLAEAVAWHLRYLSALSQAQELQERRPGQSGREEPEAASPGGGGRSLLLHLYGPWGSGKSSFLYFLRKHLVKPVAEAEGQGIERRAWVVVYFNAWRHQRLAQAWWQVLDAVFEQAHAQVHRRRGWWPALVLWLKEHWWRFWKAFTLPILAVVLGSLILWLLVPLAVKLGLVGQGTKAVADSVGLLGVVAGFGLSLTRALFAGSAQTAQSFLEVTRQPMTRIAAHFAQLIAWIDQPVAVFIDDLDRCDVAYVAQFLEDLQTLYREPRVFYVIAADRSWLRASYETKYQDFTGKVGSAAAPLGDLFLEKMFQLAIPLPSIPQQYRDSYWKGLLALEQDGRPAAEAFKDERAAARADLANASSDADAKARIAAQPKDSVRRQAYQAEALMRTVQPEVQQATEHYLQRYRHLVGSNPRAMKRMVNAYLINQLLATVADAEIPADVLPLWTILGMRWPALSDALAAHPEQISALSDDGTQAPAGLAAVVDALRQDPDVRDVVAGRDLPSAVRLDVAKIRECAKLSR